ncbi:NAD-dependent epimerase/dehydratase family protein [Streptomyces sp. NPDC001758]
MRRTESRRLVVTGGSGRVARVVVPPLAKNWRIHVIDRSAGDPSFSPERITISDMRDPGPLRRAMRGADAVLHLAANASPWSPWPVAIDNLTLAQNTLDAAAEESVPTVVLASSVHAAGGAYREGHVPVATDRPARPCCHYGTGKAAIEVAAALYHDATGAGASCLRLGLTGWPLTHRELADGWLGDADAAALVRQALSASGSGVYHGVSIHGARAWDVENATRDLGWAPQQELPVPLGSLPALEAWPCRMFSGPRRATT